MNLFRNRGLLTKMTVIIVVILLGFFALAAWRDYRHQTAMVLSEAVEKARIVAFEAINSREYLSRQLKESGVTLSEERYGLIPVVASTRIGELVAKDLGYRIRQVSERYRNPSHQPDPFEAEALRSFRENPEEGETFSILRGNGVAEFRYLRAFSADESCLECHGRPEDAPEFIRRLFPEETDQGYNYRLGEVIGAASVTIPMERLNRQIAANVRNDLLYTAGVFLALVTCLGILMKVAVTAPLGRLGGAIGHIVRTGRFEQSIPRRGSDEIGLLIDGFNEMIDNLREKTDHLEESERRFRVLTETARDAIVSFLGNGQIILFNRQAERMFGYSKREILGVCVEKLVHEECAPLFAEGVEPYLRAHCGDLVRSIHLVPARRRDGAKVMVEVSLSVAESDGHLFYTAIIREQD